MYINNLFKGGSDSSTVCQTWPTRGFSVNSRSQWRHNHLVNVFSAVPVSKLKDLFPLYTSNDLDLVCQWRSVNKKLIGHHYIIGIHLGISQVYF